MSTKPWAYIFLLLAQICVGINIVTAKVLVAHFSVWMILLVRFGVSALLLFFMYVTTPKSKKNDCVSLSSLNKKDWLFLVLQALCAGLLFNAFLYIGLDYASASMAGIITSSLPALIAGFSVVFLKEKLTLIGKWCLFLAVLGLLIVNAKGFYHQRLVNLFGTLLFILAMIPEAFYYLITKIYTNTLPLFLMSALMGLINVPFILLIMLFTGYQHLGVFTVHDLLLMMLIGLTTGLFFVFWCAGCKHVKGSTAGLFTAAMPLATLIIARIFLRESVNAFQLVGMGLVIFSIILSTRDRAVS